MTNEEIWEMLKPKMEKNGLTYLHYGYNGDGKKFFYYKDSDVINAIAVAYRSGYERCMKGRPFKIGENRAKKEKKQSGHWEPVDIEQVLKGDYKVVEDSLGWRYEYLGTCKKGADGKFYQWVEDDE